MTRNSFEGTEQLWYRQMPVRQVLVCALQNNVSKQVSNKCIAVRKVATPLRELIRHIGSQM